MLALRQVSALLPNSFCLTLSAKMDNRRMRSPWLKIFKPRIAETVSFEEAHVPSISPILLLFILVDDAIVLGTNYISDASSESISLFRFTAFNESGTWFGKRAAIANFSMLIGKFVSRDNISVTKI